MTALCVNRSFFTQDGCMDLPGGRGKRTVTSVPERFVSEERYSLFDTISIASFRVVCIVHQIEFVYSMHPSICIYTVIHEYIVL